MFFARLINWFKGGARSREPLSPAVRRALWLLVLVVYFILLYILYKSIWAWNIFD